jgi:DNA-binding protein Fis
MDDLPRYMKMETPRSHGPTELLSLAAMEKQHILRVMEATGQNKTKAAEILGMDRKTLREKLKALG